MKKSIFRAALFSFAAAWALPSLAATCQSSNDGNWNTSGTWSCGHVPTTSDTVVISNGDTVTLNVNTAAIQALTINTGGLLQTTAVRTLNLAGNLTVTGTGQINLPNTTIFLTADSQWGGTATATAISAAAIDLNGKNLTFTAAAAYTIALSGTTPLANHGSFNNNGANKLVTIQMNGAGQSWTVYSTKYPQLRISGSGTKTYGASAIEVLGSLTIDSGTTLDVTAATSTNYIGGDLTRNGTFSVPSGSGTWVFNGTTLQTISGGITLYRMTVSNSTGVQLNNGDLAIGNGSSGELDLNTGNVITGSNKVKVSTTCNSNLITGSGWVNGRLQLTFPGFSATCTFRVGDSTGLAPVTLAIPYSGSVGSLAGLTLTASTSAGEHPFIGTSGLNAAKDVNRYWTLGNGDDTLGCVPLGGDQFNQGRYTATFQFPTGDKDGSANAANFKVGRYAGGWAAPAVSGTSSTSTSIEVLASSGTASFGTFAVGEQSGSPSGNGSSSNCSNVNPIAEWRMDEAGWTGAADEVKDSTGNGYNGRAAKAAGSGPLATTAVGSSAYTNGGLSTCRYGYFDNPGSVPKREYTYVEIGSFPVLPPQFTFAAWVRTTDRTDSGQRILVNDDGQNGWGFSLGDGAAGTIRLFNRNISTAAGSVSGDGADGSCGVFCLDTNAVIANNVWYFVAVAVDTQSKDVTLYVFNNAGVQQAKVTAKFTGTWANGSGVTAIGGETAASSEGQNLAYHFQGNIDEVKVYDSALTTANLQQELTRVRACNTLDHVEYVHDGTGLTCAPEPVSVLGCTSSASCYQVTASQSGDTFSVTPNTISGAQWCSDSACNSPISGAVVLSSGATIYLRKTAAGIATMGGTGSPATNATVQCRNTVSGGYGSGSPACDVNFVARGLQVTVPNHMSCSPQTVTIKAVSNSGGSCVAGFTAGSRSATMYLSYLNPSSGTLSAGFTYPTNSSGSTSTVSSLSTSSSSPTTLTNLYWDGNATATLTNFRYPDVGQVQLNPTITVSGSTYSVVSGHQFIAAPASFSFTTLPTGNVRAAEDFTAKVSAMNACSTPAATPNFGKETPAENVALSFDSLVAPAPAAGPVYDCTNGPCNGTYSGTVASWTSGVGTSSNSNWSEVGQMKVKATLTSGNYLSSGVTTATGTSSAITFVPAYFDTEVAPGCGTAFTYSGQPFSVTATAKNAVDATTVNYSNISGCSVCSRDVTLSDKDAASTGSFSNNTIAASVFAKGIGTTTTAAYTFTNKLTAPRSLATTNPLTVRAKDSTTTYPATMPSTLSEGLTEVRSGRLRLSNAFGSEKVPLAMSVRTEYWSGNTWILNGDDSCTTLPSSANFYMIRSSTDLSSVTASTVTISAGKGTLTLSAPGNKKVGYIDIAANLGAPGSSSLSCLSSNGGTAANRSWLRSQNGNCTSTYDRDPSARATFGIYPPESRRVVDVREAF